LSISSELRRVLVEIADLSQNNVNTNVYDTSLIEGLRLPGEQISKYLNKSINPID
jgi:hypothetical protein